jgi:hypothetical protein
MTDEELEKINAERNRRGLSLLTKDRVQSQRTHYNSNPSAVPPSGFDSFSFWVGYETGFGYTPEAMLGSMFHHTSHESAPAPSNDVTFTTPDPAPSYSNDSSSSSYDSGSSSSSDSGSSGGGGD